MSNNNLVKSLKVNKDDLNESIISDTEIITYEYLRGLVNEEELTEYYNPVLWRLFIILNDKINCTEELLDILAYSDNLDKSEKEKFSRCLRKMIKIYRNSIKNISDRDLEVDVRSYNYNNTSMFHSKVLLSLKQSELKKRQSSKNNNERKGSK